MTAQDCEAEPIVCKECDGEVRVVCYWRRDDDGLVYDGPYLACDCEDDGEKMGHSGRCWRSEWFPESEAR